MQEITGNLSRSVGLYRQKFLKIVNSYKKQRLNVSPKCDKRAMCSL